MPPDPPRQGLSILIVDDDPLMTDMLPRRLKRAFRSARILTASTPEEGLRLAVQERPGVVLSDFNLRAAMDGLELLEAVEQSAPRALRILFSGHAPHEIGARLDSASLHGFLEKPLRLDELVAPLAAIIARETGVDPRREPAGG